MPAADPRPSQSASPGDGDGVADIAARLAAWAERNRIWIFAFVVIAYLAGFNGQWRTGGDSAVYLNAARHLVDPQTHPETELSPHRMPGLPWLVAAAMSVAGSSAVPIVCAVMLLINFAILALTYRLVHHLVDRGVAVIVTLFVAVNQRFLQAGYEILTDSPFLLGTMLFLVGYCGRTAGPTGELPTPRKKLLNASMMTAGLLVMLLFKRTAWVFIAALVVTIVLRFAIRSGRLRRLLGVMAGVLALGIAGYIGIVQFGSPEIKRLFMAHLFEKFGTADTLTLYAENFIIIFEKFRGNGPAAVQGVIGIELFYGVNTLVAVALLGFGIRTGRLNALLGCYIACSIAAFVVHTTGERYFLALLPILALGWWQAMGWISRRLPTNVRDFAFIALFVLWIGPNVVQSGITIVEQRRVPFIDYFDGGKHKPLIEMAALIEQHVGPNDLVVSPKHAQIMYFSGRPALSDRSINRNRDLQRDYIAKLRETTERFFIVVELDDAGQPQISEKMQKRVFDDPDWMYLELVEPPIAVVEGRRNYGLFEARSKKRISDVP